MTMKARIISSIYYVSSKKIFFLLSILLLLTGLLGNATAAGQTIPDVVEATNGSAPPEAALPGLLVNSPNSPIQASLLESAASCAEPYCIFLPSILRQVATLDRATSLTLYQTLFLTGEGVSSGWNGNVGSCSPGTTSAAFKTAVINRINYFRQAAGVPPITGLDATYNQKAQAAALMMSRQGALSHSPDSNWGCYTAVGAEAAGRSNLGLGMFGPGAIHSYMRDHGSGNTAAGHRRWILFPQTRYMGSGDIPSSGSYRAAQALWVITPDSGNPRPATRTMFVAWPPSGYIPYQVVYARWSFSYPNANFNNASVTLNQGGTNIPVTKYPVANGYGENTLVWIINGMSDTAGWSRPAQDTSYTVTITGVVINGQTMSFTYSVVIFDPG